MSEDIKFTDSHIQKIQDGEKVSTLRKVKEKNVFPIGNYLSLGDGEGYIFIKDRRVVELHREKMDPVDAGLEFSPGMPGLAGMEGFSSIEAMINWFENRNYTLPGKFFLYQFDYSENPEKQELILDEQR